MFLQRTAKRVITGLLRASDNLVHQIGKAAHVTSENNAETNLKRRVTNAPVQVENGNSPRVIRLGFLEHSLMRSIELNMLTNLSSYLYPPIIDIGCGDGQFSSLILDEISTGVDVDPYIFRVTRALVPNLYHQLLFANASQTLPLKGDTYRTAISNSVLEHIPNISCVVAEVSRLLKIGGTFVFTTYTPAFTAYLTSFFGSGEAARFNRELSHVSLLSVEQWRILLATHGLEILKIEYYLPQSTTIHMRLMSSRAFQAIQVLIPKLVWHIMRRKFKRTVTRSINLSVGAGIAVVARKIQ